MLQDAHVNCPTRDFARRKSFCIKLVVSAGTLCLVMKEYDLVVIGTGSGMVIADAAIQETPDLKVAVIDKDEPGGICLIKCCTPSKLLFYPADIIRTIQKSREFGVHTEIKKIDFEAIMERKRLTINRDINMIRTGLSNSKNMDYYTDQAEFTAHTPSKSETKT
jgi:mycothione reductase